MSSDSFTVALITPWDTGGGIADYSKRLRSALESTGHDVSVLPIQNPHTRNPFGLRDIIKRIPAGIDVVHVQFEAGVFGRLLISGICAPAFYAQLVRSDLPIVTTPHEIHRDHSEHSSIESSLVTMRDRLLERIILSVSDATVVHTDEAKMILREKHGDKYLIERMRHPVDDPFAPPEDRERARKSLGVTADTVLLTFGWVESKKRYQDVIRSLPNLSDSEYLIAGEPRYENDEETLQSAFALAERLGVRDRVTHLGYVKEENLPTLFGASDIAIVPYNQVTQSGAVNTALAYHCPVVAKALPAFEELGAEYDCIMTYDNHNDLDNLVQNITSDGVSLHLREAAKQYTETETWTAFGKRTAGVYDDVVERRSEPASTY